MFVPGILQGVYFGFGVFKGIDCGYFDAYRMR